YFGEASSALGANVSLDGRRYVVVGIAPEGFDFPLATQVWLPRIVGEAMRLSPRAGSQNLPTYGGSSGWVGKLRSGVTGEQTRGELLALLSQLQDRYGRQ